MPNEAAIRNPRGGVETPAVTLSRGKDSFYTDSNAQGDACLSAGHLTHFQLVARFPRTAFTLQTVENPLPVIFAVFRML